MKKTLCLLIILQLAYGLYAQNGTLNSFINHRGKSLPIMRKVGKNNADYNIKAYATLGMQGINNQNMLDFHISDWQEFGLGSLEGRVSVPLSERQLSSSVFFNIGAEFAERVTLDISIGFGKINFVSGMLGGNYKFIKGEKFKLGINPKIGYASVTANMGEVAVIPGKTPPVIIGDNSFTVGDKIRVQTNGFLAQVGLVPEYQVTERIGIRASIGYSYFLGGKAKVKITTSDANTGDVELVLTDRSIVKPNGTSQQYANEPKFGLTGLVFQLGVSYGLNF
jgi:hypothetical protein